MANSCNVLVFYKKIFSNKFDLFWTTTLFLQKGLYHPPDGVTNLKYKLLYFLTPIKKKSKRKALAFTRDRCCYMAICLWLILFH